MSSLLISENGMWMVYLKSGLVSLPRLNSSYGRLVIKNLTVERSVAFAEEKNFSSSVIKPFLSSLEHSSNASITKMISPQAGDEAQYSSSFHNISKLSLRESFPV